MCGIYGYVGEETDLGPQVLDALKMLEYRGYDSWGVGVAVNGHIEVQKQPGKIADATVEVAACVVRVVRVARLLHLQGLRRRAGVGSAVDAEGVRLRERRQRVLQPRGSPEQLGVPALPRLSRRRTVRSARRPGSARPARR